MCKKAIVLVVTLFLIVILSFPVVSASASTDTTVILDGVIIHSDVKPLVVNGRTFLPFRAVFEAFGAEVFWDVGNGEVTGIKEDRIVQFILGNNNFFVNGARIGMDASPVLVEGRTMVPVRFVATAMGASVDWDSVSNVVNIKTVPVHAPPMSNVKQEDEGDGIKLYTTEFGSKLTADYLIPELGYQYKYRDSDGFESTSTWSRIGSGQYLLSSEGYDNFLDNKIVTSIYRIDNDGVYCVKITRIGNYKSCGQLVRFLSGEFMQLPFTVPGSSWDKIYNINQEVNQDGFKHYATRIINTSVKYKGTVKIQIIGREMEAAHFEYQGYNSDRAGKDRDLWGDWKPNWESTSGMFFGEYWSVKGLGTVKGNSTYSTVDGETTHHSYELISVTPK